VTIVCGTDFSQPARDAVAVAAKLSCRLKQDLVLVHAVVPHAGDPMGFDFEPLRAAMAGALEHEAAELRSAGLNVATRAVIGWPEEEIVKTAREAGADLIVMGALGRHQGLYWLIGSVAERVAQTTPVPLLLVRDPKPLQSWIEGNERLRVLHPTDFTPVSDVALDWLQTLDRVGPCDVLIEYVSNPAVDSARLNLHGPVPNKRLPPILDEVLQRELRKRAERLPAGSVSTTVKLSMSEPSGEIATTAAEERIALVVVGSHQRRAIDRIVHGRVSQGVIHASATNVVCVPFHTDDEPFRALEAPNIHTILAATDFSPCGNHAVAWAMAIAPPASRVVVFNVAEDSQARAKASTELAQIEHPRSWPDNVEVAVAVASNGDIAKAIWAQAQVCNADVIVVGAHGESGLRAILGSVARELLAVSAKPVLVVRDEASH